MRSLYLVKNPHLLVMLGAFLCYSPNGTTDELNEIYSLRLEQLLDIEIEVATRSSQTIVNSPSTVTVFSAQEINRMGIHSLETLLNFVSGFQTARTDDDGRAYTLSVRGRRSSSSGFDTLVLLDGMRLNDIISGGAFGQDSQIAIENLKQVEIIRGPGSALYGSNAFTAVVNLVSKPLDNYVSIGGGSFSGETASIGFSDKFIGLEWSVYGRFYQDQGKKYAPFYNFLSLETVTGDAKKQSDIYIRGVSEQWEIYLRQAKRVYDDFILAGALAIEGQRLKNDNRSARMVYHYKPNDSLTISPYADYSDNDQDSLLALFPAVPDSEPNYFWDDGSNVAGIGGNIRTTIHKRLGVDGQWQFDTENLLSFGALWRRESVGENPFHGNWDRQRLLDDNMFVPNETGQTVEDFWIDGVKFDLFTPQRREVTGVYLQHQWQINRQLTFTSGIRNDRYDDFGSNNSLRGGLVYQANDERTIKLLYGEAFRAPTFLESRAGIASGGLSNPELRPETVKTYEFAWFERFSFGRITATLFNNQLFDTVIEVKIDDTVTGLTATQPQNTADVDINGIEIEADVELAKSWLLKAGFSHIFDKKAGEPVANTTGFIALNYKNEWQQKPFNLNLNGYYHDKVFSRSSEIIASSEDIYIASFWNWRLAATMSIFDNWQAKLTVENLLDEDFATYTRQIGIDNGLPSRGRAWQMSVEYQF